MGRVTIADVASRAGVSSAAVSFALNGRVGVSEATRQRVLAVAAEMGWRPSSAARSLSIAKADTIGLVLARDPGMLGVESFYMQFIAGIEIELERRSVGLLLQVVPSLEAELGQYEVWQASRRVDGVVCTDLRVDDPRVGVLSRPGALPAVLVGDASLTGGLTNVWTDDATATRTLVRHLWSEGHRRFVRVAGPPEYGHTRIRDDAFRDEVRRLGAEGTIVPTDYSPDQGARATRDRLGVAGQRPTAFVYDNDVMALAGLSVAHSLGVRVPEDVSIVAWDDSPLCEAAYPRLTAMSHDVTGFGTHVTRRLFEVLEGQVGGSYLDSTPQLRLRGTSGPVAA